MAMEGEDYISGETLMQFTEVVPDAAGMAQAEAAVTGEVPFNAALERFEADLLKGLLKRHGGNIDAAAREAGMNMATMYRKIKRYGIRKEDYS
jgi:DNA-binding NtrC family response regulator